ncbi:MAG: 50S ribosomal protein L9 [Muribaculaceae bacterium]|nr:50S ribosomal protein L9 [Muribaculaceae bacterium]
MKLILKEDIANLGYKDDIVEVKNGYGRNYLVPQGKAILATPQALKIHAENLRQRAHKLEKIKADAQSQADALKEVALTIPAAVNATGTLYSAVGAAQVAEALAAAGYEVDRKLISVKEVVKELGKYTAEIRFHKEVAIEVPFEVVAE